MMRLSIPTARFLLLQALFAQHTLTAVIVPPDTSLDTMPVAYYGAQWDRDDANIDGLAKLQIVVLMQEEGPCWTTCCPNASTSQGGLCNPYFNATSLPGCDPSCDQHGYQNKIFERIKFAAASKGIRPPHCMVFANTIYDWPFMSTHALGNEVDVVSTNGHPHIESCDPGIFPSYFFDYSKEGGRQGYLDIVTRLVINGSADGVYADCYTTMGLTCDVNGTNCVAKRNGKVQSYNEKVTATQVDEYVLGKNHTMHQVSVMVGENGTVFAKGSGEDVPAKFGGNLMFLKVQGLNVSGTIAQVKETLEYYKYIVVGAGNDYKHPSTGGGHGAETSKCSEDQVAVFLLAIEPGCFILCHGWDETWGEAKLGKPLSPATQDSQGTWSRTFSSGTVAKYENGKGSVAWSKL